jgi:SAM-dependent methyltransferase
MMETKLSANMTLPPPKLSFAGFFNSVQDAPWYRLFLMPAIDELCTLPPGVKVLDVGTGPGKFIELAQEYFPLSYVGVDVDDAMLAAARQRPALANVPLFKIEPGQRLPFDDAAFDAVSLCSVLFTLPDPRSLLKEILRILRPGGKLVVLTPTGRGSFKQELKILAQLNFGVRNWSFFLWQNMTRSGGRRWEAEKRLPDVAEKNGLAYSQQLVFSEFSPKYSPFYSDNQRQISHSQILPAGRTAQSRPNKGGTVCLRDRSIQSVIAFDL